MNARTKIVIASLLIVFVLLASACQPKLQTVTVVTVVAGTPVVKTETKIVTVTPVAMKAPEATKPSTMLGAISQSGVSDIRAAPYRANQMIIKNGEMSLLVADTNQALDRVTDVAVETGGYVVSSKTWTQGDYVFASLTMGVPVDQFETAQRRLRALAIRVLSESASGQDVSAEYVDTQSRVANLEATAARIREFLKQAKDAKEALAVNADLTEVEAQIEQAKGRMQYLRDRSAFSTLAVSLEPQRPTPTPTPRAVWRPDKTFAAATTTLADMLRGIGDALIWFAVVIIAPLSLPAVIIWAIWRRARQKLARRAAASALQSTAGDPQ